MGMDLSESKKKKKYIHTYHTNTFILFLFFFFKACIAQVTIKKKKKKNQPNTLLSFSLSFFFTLFIYNILLIHFFIDKDDCVIFGSVTPSNIIRVWSQTSKGVQTSFYEMKFLSILCNRQMYLTGDTRFGRDAPSEMREVLRSLYCMNSASCLY